MASLTTVAVQEIANLQKEDGRQRLRELLKWKKFDEERDLRPGILLDFVYESVVFAVKKGFPWHSVARVIKISQELLNDSKDLSVTKAVELLRNKLSKCETQLAQNHQLDFLDFLMGTFIRHHGLYQFVLRGQREVDCIVTELQVHTPPNPLPLSEGTDSQVWQYQQRMATLTGDENQKRINMLLLKETAYREAEERLDMLYKDFTVQDTGTLERQVLEKVVQDAVRSQVEVLEEVLLKEVQLSLEILELKLQQKTLPRPNAPPTLTNSLASTKTETTAGSTSKTTFARAPKGKKR
ncbi:hypothetical protein AOXY_G7181 [Acipenser oxyrinchus oxyrinchus]|uniref:Uncharacterized protein n=1 Tax=Acipenser oxyrinchus oxyrinchus TaxID=40147 RepID=A0AAD8G9P6_ACIOX|nr:hypothetical protein AOXY_G7181 [Acipenser oxyrinchus oxyrinchus]